MEREIQATDIGFSLELYCRFRLRREMLRMADSEIRVGNVSSINYETILTQQLAYSSLRALIVPVNVVSFLFALFSAAIAFFCASAAWDIAKELLDSPLRYADIYNLNQEVIESEARAPLLLPFERWATSTFCPTCGMRYSSLFVKTGNSFVTESSLSLYVTRTIPVS